MKGGPPYTQRAVFWGSMLNGAAGLTYGAAGIWHAGIEGFPASVNTYDFTTWEQGKVYPGSAQVGLNAKFLRGYPWEKFLPHREWVRGDMYAAGIPGEIRIIYSPRWRPYRWEGFRVKDLEPGISYRTFFFDPSTGRRFDYPTVEYCADAKTVYTDSLQKDEHWERKNEFSILQQELGEYLTVRVDIQKKSEAGVVVHYTDPKNYLLGIYSGGKIFFRQIINGKSNELPGGGAGPLTRGARRLPETAPDKIAMSVTVQDDTATIRMQGEGLDIANTVEISPMESGKIGLWRGAAATAVKKGKVEDAFGGFTLAGGSGAANTQPYKNLSVINVPNRKPGIHYLTDSTLHIERIPSPQDWVFVMESDVNAEHLKKARGAAWLEVNPRWKLFRGAYDYRHRKK